MQKFVKLILTFLFPKAKSVYSQRKINPQAQNAALRVQGEEGITSKTEIMNDVM